jgi:phosphatidylserine/phosphatidylglycerophosphate/cardiolipin synthase-like enzyme
MNYLAASLHAKCVIVDRSRALVTSAHFTDAAQRKNIEVGGRLRQRQSQSFTSASRARLDERGIHHAVAVQGEAGHG